MRYEKPRVKRIATALDAVQHAQEKGLATLVETIFPVFTFITPFAYEADE